MKQWFVRTTIATVLALAASTTVASAQETGSITGVVTDVGTGQPLSGAQVTIVGTRQGTIANAQGRYLLTGVPTGQVTVRTQIIGYASGEQVVNVTSGSAATANFDLQPQAVELEGLVVVGYGQQQRGDVTGAVSSVTAEEFIESPARDAAALIAGKIAGLTVNQPSGDPTEESEISLRGFGSINASREPLIIVDGVPGSLETLAPQDIASIDVLKDGSAAAVYGSRAANGVIFITSKKYDGSQPTIRYNGYTSLQTIYNQPDFLTAADYRRLVAEGYTTPAGNTFEDLGYQTNWQDQVLRDNPLGHNHNLTVMGGSGETNYTASFNYEYAEGLFQRSDNKEVTGRVNIGHSMFDGKLAADLNAVTRVQNRFYGQGDNGFNGIWRQTLIRNPTDRVYTEEGDWQTRGGYVYYNPVQQLYTDHGEREDRDLRLHGTLTFRPIDQFSVSLMGGTERGQRLDGWNRTSDNPYNAGLNYASRFTESEESQILELTGTYREVFGGHQVTLLGGYSYWDNLEEDFGASNERFPTDLFGFSDLGSGAGLPEGEAGIGSGKESYKTLGFFSRLNWDWDNRFLAMASVRYEGDSRFGADNKWGVFPGLSLGWRISEESFVPQDGFINDLKLRAGYGVTGIAPRDPYQSLTTYNYGGRYPVGGRWMQGLSPSRNPNPDLRWERKEEINLGVDFSLFDYRLAGSLDVYQRDTEDMLYDYSVPVPPYLFGSIRANVGTMRNEGIEASLTYDLIRRANFRWRANANWSTNRNELVSLSDDVFQTSDFFYAGHTGEPIQTSTHRIDVGGPIGNFYGYESVDITDDGEWIVLDSAGARIPYSDVRSQDRRVLGNGIPDHYAALNNSFRYGGFDLNVNMRGAFGHQVLNYQRLYYENPKNTQYNMLKSAFHDVYGKTQLNYDLVYVSYYIEDGDYWKVDNATLGYTFGPETLPGFMSAALDNARLYVSGRNLWTITGYKGMDPEVQISGLSPGEDQRDKYPTTRTFTAGINLTF